MPAVRTRGGSVARFFEQNFRHTKGPRAGKPFVLEDFQRAFTDEFYRVNSKGRRLYRTGLLGIPRGNGKSPLAAGYGLYELRARTDAPDVFVAAAARDQARIISDFANSFVVGLPGSPGPLAAWMEPRASAVLLPSNQGVMKVLSSDGSLQHGLSVSAALVDELHAFETHKQDELYVALRTATHKRPDSFLLSITTAGYNKETRLGRIYDAALSMPSIERPHDCLTIARDEEAGFLFWWYGAPEGCSIDDTDLWMRANPASWVTVEDLWAQLHSPDLDENEFRRLHLNQWTLARDAWLPAGCWDGLASVEDERPSIPDGAEIYVGVDVGLKHDSTAVAWAHVRPDGKIAADCKVWASKRDAVAHEHRQEIRLGEVEEWILGELAPRYHIKELVYDPRFFPRSAEIIAADRRCDFPVAPLEQNSKEMADAYQGFYQAAKEGKIVHDGDSVLRSHVESTGATLTDTGWRVFKVRATARIDACVALCMAHGRALVGRPQGFAFVVKRKRTCVCEHDREAHFHTVHGDWLGCTAPDCGCILFRDERDE